MENAEGVPRIPWEVVVHAMSNDLQHHALSSLKDWASRMLCEPQIHRSPFWINVRKEQSAAQLWLDIHDCVRKVRVAAIDRDGTKQKSCRNALSVFEMPAAAFTIAMGKVAIRCLVVATSSIVLQERRSEELG
jgi:hypothetical protein